MLHHSVDTFFADNGGRVVAQVEKGLEAGGGVCLLLHPRRRPEFQTYVWRLPGLDPFTVWKKTIREMKLSATVLAEKEVY